MHGAYYKWDSAALFLSCVDSTCERANVRACECVVYQVHLYSYLFIVEPAKVYLYSWAKGRPLNQEFFVQVQRTEGNGGSDKATSEQRPANLASVSSAARIQPVTSTVDKTVILKLLEQNFPECIDGNQFHSFYQCKESCKLKKPAFQSSLKGDG